MPWKQAALPPHSAARGGTKRNPGLRSASIPSGMSTGNGIPRTSGRSYGTSLTRRSIKGKHSRVSPVELDRAGHLALHPRGNNSYRAAVLREGTGSRGAKWFSGIDPREGRAVARRENEAREVPHALARLRAMYGGDSLRSGHGPQDYRGDDFFSPVGTREPGHR